ncbi:Protein kinase of the Mitotic Exit Network [Dispira simplex]|nr:Protein kinase of the Mitotic Exit Network [Dispira simplex]
MTTVHQYQLGDCIGKGAFGTVYRGLHLENGQVVAIKEIPLRNAAVLDTELKGTSAPTTALNESPVRGNTLVVVDRPSAAKTPAAKKGSQEYDPLLNNGMVEINILKKLQHENIVRYLGFAQTNDSLYQILEYCENGSLRSIYKKFGRFPEKLVGVYLQQILAGLRYLHHQGIIHRDIKGANILSTKTGQVKLADFGVSTRDTDGGPTPSGGSPYWMAPEVVELNDVTTAADIWSLGCTVIELLQAEPPYGRLSSMAALFRMVQDSHPPFPAGISAKVQHFLKHCFNKKPHQRATASQLLQHSWLNSIQDVKLSQNAPRPLRNAVSGTTNVPTNPVTKESSVQSFQTAIQTVKEWNESLRQATVAKFDALSIATQTGKTPLPIKRDISRYRSPDSNNESWDWDFDDLSNLTPSNLRPADRLFELTLSPDTKSTPTRRPLVATTDGRATHVDDPASPCLGEVLTSSSVELGSADARGLPTPLMAGSRMSPRANLCQSAFFPMRSMPQDSLGYSNTQPLFLSSQREREQNPPDHWDDAYELPDHDLLSRLEKVDSRPLRRSTTNRSNYSIESQPEGSTTATLFASELSFRSHSDESRVESGRTCKPTVASKEVHYGGIAIGRHSGLMESTATSPEKVSILSLTQASFYCDPSQTSVHPGDSSDNPSHEMGYPSWYSQSGEDRISRDSRGDRTLSLVSQHGPNGSWQPRSRQVSFDLHVDKPDLTIVTADQDLEIELDHPSLLSQERLQKVAEERARARAQSLSALTCPSLPDQAAVTSNAHVPPRRAPISRPRSTTLQTQSGGTCHTLSFGSTVSSTRSWQSSTHSTNPVLPVDHPEEGCLGGELEQLLVDLAREMSAANILASCQHMMVILTNYPTTKTWIAHDSKLLTLVYLIQSGQPPEVLIALLGVLNALVDQQPQTLKLLAHHGCLVRVLQLLNTNGTSTAKSDDLPRDLQLEIAFFIKQLCLGKGSRLMTYFLAAQGAQALVTLLSFDVYAPKDQRELVWIVVDVLAAILHAHSASQRVWLVHHWAQCGILDPLAYAFYRFAGHPSETGYLKKMAYIFYHLVRADAWIRERYVSPSVCKRIVKTLRALSPEVLTMIVKVLAVLAQDSTTVESLDQTKLIEVLVHLLGNSGLRQSQGQRQDLVQQINCTLFHLCRFNSKRQMRAVAAGALPFWIHFSDKHDPQREFTIPLLCDLVHHSVVLNYLFNTTSETKQESNNSRSSWHSSTEGAGAAPGGMVNAIPKPTVVCRDWTKRMLTFYISLLDEEAWYPRALDALLALHRRYPERVVERLLKTGLHDLVRTFCHSSPSQVNFDRMLTALLKLLHASPQMCHHSAKVVFDPLSTLGNDMPQAVASPRSETRSATTPAQDDIASTSCPLLNLLARCGQASATTQGNLLKLVLLLFRHYGALHTQRKLLRNWYRWLKRWRKESSSVVVQDMAWQVMEWIERHYSSA